MRKCLFPCAVLIIGMLALFGLPACSSSSNGSGDGSNDDGSNNSDGNSDGSSNGDINKDGAVGPGDLPICDEFEIQAGSIPPNLLLVVDKSGSMDYATAAGSNRKKIDDAKAALTMLLTEGDGKIRFGWLPYPIGSECTPGVVTVECADDSVSAIQILVNTLRANGGTPTGESLNNANSYTGLHDEGRNNFVVLLTDGMPTCPNGDGRTENAADNALALTAVESLHAAGIDTFVIGLGEDINNSNPDLLNDMAEAGGRPRAAAVKYYQANSLADLEAALQDIGGMVIGCNLSLDTEPEYPNWLWVFFCDVNGENCVAQSRDRDHVNGWDYNDANNQINFYGPMCDQLRAGTIEHLEVLMGCAPPD
ncbi:MAG: VWA domain-containing protein [Deltaproteobacteria bacterium]|nr:VWA domain-containing protein [Deltaproteobacteria bacterium]MBW1871020.1 VWA domain-containing protein [Deltaproteobacteria bacterium]